MKFTRQVPRRKYKRYQSYRRFTREDFRQFCAYCSRHEQEAGEQFDQDHFEPRSVSPARENDFLNLYWSCKPCNNYKLGWWPSRTQERRGEVFVDPCDHDPVGVDYKETRNGRLKQLSPAGEFTIRHIRLNRPALVQNRLDRKHVRREYQEKLQRLRRELRELQDALRGSPSSALQSLLSEVKGYSAFVSRDPFILAFFPHVARSK